MAEEHTSVSWYYSRNGRQEGPLDEFQFADLVQSGQIRGKDRVWRSGWDEWQFARDVPELVVADDDEAEAAQPAPVAPAPPAAGTAARPAVVPPITPARVRDDAAKPAAPVPEPASQSVFGRIEADPARARPFVSGEQQEVAGRPLWESAPPLVERRRSRNPFSGGERRSAAKISRSPRGELEQHSRVLALLLAASIVAFAVASASNLLQLKLVLDNEAGLFADQAARSAAGQMNDLRQAIVGWTQVAVVLVTAVVFLTWIYRANANVRKLGAEKMTDTPGWAVGWFAIPFYQFWKPYRALDELWRASAAPLSWQEEKAPSSILAWWITVLALPLWLAADIGVRIWFTGNAGAQYKAATVVGIVANLVGVASAVLALKFVRQIGAFQTGVAARPRSAVTA